MIFLSAKRVRELLSYEEKTGIFIWKAKSSKTVRARIGSIAGSESGDGYRRIGIDGRDYLAHRLAYLYMTNAWPKAQVDHKDLNRANNCWTNLREATNGQNMANGSLRSDNTSGFKGVTWSKRARKWQAQIGVEGVNKYIGSFATPEDAHTAYVTAAEEHFGAFARAA